LLVLLILIVLVLFLLNKLTEVNTITANMVKIMINLILRIILSLSIKTQFKTLKLPISLKPNQLKPDFLALNIYSLDLNRDFVTHMKGRMTMSTF